MQICGRTIRVDHVRQYRRPKDENGEEIIEKGCAPKTPSPSPVSSPAASPSPPPLELKKKAKKKKKDKSKEKGAKLANTDVKEEAPEQLSWRGGSEGRREIDKPSHPEKDTGIRRELLHHSSREDYRWERSRKEPRLSPSERQHRRAESSRHDGGGHKMGIRMEERRCGYRPRSDSDSSGTDERAERREGQYRREGKARRVVESSRHRSRSPVRLPQKDHHRQHRTNRH